MKWYLLIGTIIVVTVVILLFVFSGSSENVDTTQPTPGLPVAGSVAPNNEPGSSGAITTGATLSFTTRSGATAIVKDFVHNGETVADVVNPGSYVLAGTVGYCLADGTCPAGYSTTNFNISYDEKTHFFNVVLLKEPLGTVRLEAEQFLANRLGITGQQLCSLDYSIGAPYWVNTAYADKNLGFSFCPGATALPQ